jgi:hypothetical protein
MAKTIAIVVAGIAIFLLVRETTTTRTDYSLGFQAAMDNLRPRAHEDFEGDLGQKAREVCNRSLGITVPVKSGQDVLRQYDPKKAMAFTDCVVDRMYPDSARSR